MNELWGLPALLSEIEQVYQREGMSEFWPSESGHVRGALEAISQRLRPRRFNPRMPGAVLGVGGSGIVLRLKDQLFPQSDSALKFPRPVSGKIRLVAEMLSKEMAELAKLRHAGIVRITYYGTHQGAEGYGDLPFYLMDAVDGAKSDKFVGRPDTTEKQLLSLLQNVADVLCYLHASAGGGIVHLDIKPDNIVVDSSGRAVMIDLGTCKRLGVDSSTTTVACTRSFAHPALVRRLVTDPSDEKRAKGEIPRSEIDRRWDLWSFGQTLLSWLSIDFYNGATKKDSLFWRLTPYVRKYLLLLAARLLADGLPEWMPKRIGLGSEFLTAFPLETADELCEVIRRVDGTVGPLAEIPELSSVQDGIIQASPEQHVIRTNRLRLVLEHRLFRRLNSISQLGLVSQVYPGAKHTRREHSLGTYANCGRILQALWRDPVSPLFRQIITEQDCRDVLLIALLHDIGQFPMAHDFEEIDNRLFDHGELTQAMLRGVWDKKKKGARKLVFASLAEIFVAWETSEERLIAILNAKPTSTTAPARQKLLRSIISGPIDGDKLDYLFRDARQTNLRYPAGIDVAMIFRSLTTIVIPRVEGSARDVLAIGIHAKGKVAAEFLSFARYAMFAQAYWHHTVRAQKAMLFRGVEALIAKNSSEPKLMELLSEFFHMVFDLPENLYEPEAATLFKGEEHKSAREELRALGEGTDLSTTDAAVLSWLRERLRGAGCPEAMLIDRLLRRDLFKRLWVVTPDMDERRWARIVGSWDQLSRQNRHQIGRAFEKEIARRLDSNAVTVTGMDARDARDQIGQRTAGNVPWLLIDIPGARPGSETGLYCVLESQGRSLRKDERVVGDLQASPVWERYARDLRGVAGKIRVFCDPGLVDTVDASLRLEVGMDDLMGVLERFAQ